MRLSRFLVCVAAARAVFVIDGAIVSRRISSDPRRSFLRLAFLFVRIIVFVIIRRVYGIGVRSPVGLRRCPVFFSIVQCNTKFFDPEDYQCTRKGPKEMLRLFCIKRFPNSPFIYQVSSAVCKRYSTDRGEH